MDRLVNTVERQGMTEFPFERPGYCCICEKNVIYTITGPYFRNTLKCPECKLSPRYRHLFFNLNKFFPNWRSMDIHESSPGFDKLSQRLSREAKSYTATQFDPTIPFGSLHPKGYRSEDLQCQTFSNECFDLVVTQDVFEHL